MEKVTFSTVLREIMFDEDMNLKEFYNQINNLNLKIGYTTLYNYYSGITVPSVTIAKNILKKAHYNISDIELEELLEYSKQFNQNEGNDNKKILRLNLKIKPDLISKEYEMKPEALRTVIELRSKELFTNKEFMRMFDVDGKGKISAYIAYLIKKDLEENDIVKGEKNNG